MDFFKRHAPKITFAGYLLPQQQVVREEKNNDLQGPRIPKNTCRVAVLRGGGAYFPKLIAQAIRASDLLGDGYFLTIVAGPSTTAEEWSLFKTLLKKKKIKNAALLLSIGDYEGLIKKSDVCVSTGSYHTSVMLLKLQKKAVIIPFEGEGSQSMHEQPARAALLKEMIGARIVAIRNLTATSLADAVINVDCQRALPPVPQKFFTGREVLDQSLKGLF